MDANLLVTYDYVHKQKAEQETRALLKEVGEEAKFIDSGVDGVFLLRVDNGKKVVKQLYCLCKTDPSRFNYTFNWIPIEKWCSSEIGEIGSVMKEFNKKMDPEKKWKMGVVKRYYDKMKTMDIVMALTKHIEKPKVDLDNPDVIIRVEILGERAGCSLLNKDELLNVPGMKRQ